MVYVSSKQKFEEEFTSKLDRHALEVEKQKDVTYFFIVIVGVTLVATLVGLVTLYISTLKDSINSNDSSKEKVDQLSNELLLMRMEIEILKAKNPYLK